MRTVNAIAGGIRAAGAVSPRLGGAAALAAFFSTRPHARVPERDADVDGVAERDVLLVRGRRIVGYRWGEGREVVALAHGWRGRASQFAPLVRALVDAGHTVVAFDVPGHGATRGRRVDVRDWVAALEALQTRYGRFRAVVGHSFGGFTALTAVRHGLETDAVVTAAAAGAPRAFIDEFARQLSLAAPTRAELERRFLRRIGETPASVIETYDAIASPLPSQVELLILHGDADRQLPAEESRRLHAAHPHARLMLVEGVGHNRLLASGEFVDGVLGLLGSRVG